MRLGYIQPLRGELEDSRQRLLDQIVPLVGKGLIDQMKAATLMTLLETAPAYMISLLNEVWDVFTDPLIAPISSGQDAGKPPGNWTVLPYPFTTDEGLICAVKMIADYKVRVENDLVEFAAQTATGDRLMKQGLAVLEELRETLKAKFPEAKLDGSFGLKRGVDGKFVLIQNDRRQKTDRPVVSDLTEELEDLFKTQENVKQTFYESEQSFATADRIAAEVRSACQIIDCLGEAAKRILGDELAAKIAAAQARLVLASGKPVLLVRNDAGQGDDQPKTD